MITRTHLLRQFGFLRTFSAFLTVLPLLALPVLGMVWLWQSDHRLAWLIILGGCALAGYVLHLLSRKNTGSSGLPATEADPLWPPSTAPCWEKVERLAEEANLQDWPLTDIEKLALLGRKTLETVAGHYHPESSRPLLELTVPHALLIIERASRDLRAEIVANIPLSHRLNMGTLVSAQRWKETIIRYEPLFRAGRLLLNPSSSVFYELRRGLGNRIAGYGLERVKTWMLREYVRKVGRYAIDLYSGRLLLDKGAGEAAPGADDRDSREAGGDHGPRTAEPLRILVLGRANSGKSSLINALFGEVAAASDILPHTTREVHAYRLQREGQMEALILDAPGCDTDLFGEQALEKEALNADLILWVVSAVRGDRQEDKKRLDLIRSRYAHHVTRRSPPMLAVVSHIDKLRPFTEWSPPYDLTDPANPKAVNIAAAVDVIARDLDFPPDLTIPVCLAPDRLYNVEDTLAAVIMEQSDEGRKAQYLRCLEVRKKREGWEKVIVQMRNAGRLVTDWLK